MTLRTSFLAVVAVLALAGGARAQQIAYSNVTNFSGFGDTNGFGGTSGANSITSLVADDIAVAPGFAGGTVTGFVFSTANFNATNVTARPRVRFYSLDDTTGAPTTFLGGIDFDPVSLTAGSVQLLNFAPNTPLFTVPANGLFWAGITFDNNNGTTGATLAELNNLGQGIFSPPTVGSSDDVFFATDSFGDFAANNPAGDFYFYGGNPVANYGWEFTVIPVPIPEPTGVAGAAALVLTGGAWLKRRRRAGVAAAA